MVIKLKVVGTPQHMLPGTTWTGYLQDIPQRWQNNFWRRRLSSCCSQFIITKQSCINIRRDIIVEISVDTHVSPHKLTRKNDWHSSDSESFLFVNVSLPIMWMSCMIIFRQISVLRFEDLRTYTAPNVYVVEGLVRSFTLVSLVYSFLSTGTLGSLKGNEFLKLNMISL
jgi:hypothetical protein